jgi:hypothetical protein
LRATSSFFVITKLIFFLQSRVCLLSSRRNERKESTSSYTFMINKSCHNDLITVFPFRETQVAMMRDSLTLFLDRSMRVCPTTAVTTREAKEMIGWRAKEA